MVLSFLLAGGLAFDRPATRLELLLPELSTAVGQRLRVSAALRDERLVIAWRDRPSADLLKAVAEVCAAEWQRDEDGLRLVRPPAMERRLSRAALDLRVDAVKKDLAARKPLPPLDAQALREKIDRWYRGEREIDDVGNDGIVKQDDARQALFAQGPGGRLGDRLARLLPPERYADLVDEERRVFSTRPTSAQSRLGAEFAPLLEAFCRENDAMLATKGAKRNRIWSGDPTAELRQVKPSELVLEVEATTYWGMRPYCLIVRVRKPNDPVLLAAHVEMAGYEEGGKPLVEDPTPYVAVAWPTRTTEERQSRLRRPDLFDPMADRLLDLPRLAALRKRDLVARVDDSMGLAAPFLSLEREKKGLTVGKALSRLLSEDHSLRDDGKTMLIAPLDEPAHQRNDCDRRDLAGLVAATEREGYASLEASAAFAQRNGKRAFEGLGQRFVDLARPGAGSAFGDLDVETLRFYGALAPAQRAAVLAGGRVPVLNLGPAARAQAVKLVFGLQPRHDINDTEWIAQASASATTDFGGMPAGAFVTGADAREPIIYSLFTSEGREYRHVQDAANLGQGLGMAEGNGKPFDPDEAYKKVVPGERRRVTLKIVLDPKRMETLALKEDRFPASAKPVGYAALPAAFRQAVRAKADAQAKVTREHRAGRKKRTTP